uniref:Transposable element P transposase-like RNase H domain-containing protein n=1 Tax=Schizaphis graminum TaxID=13262 RepID=A0A2S2P2Y1_SCHGA
MFYYRSSTTYNFLREQDILPLPCPRTIRWCLSLINIQCGFDKQFFQLLKKRVGVLTNEQKHGMLVFDEIFLKESFNVNSQTLTHSGLEDFGDEIDSSWLKANHALVFIYQSLSLNFTQSIAVFASRGPVKGNQIIPM